MGVRVGSTTLPMPRGGGPELNEYAQEVKVILETAFSEIGGAGTGLLAANNLSDLISAATARINLGLAIGTNVEAWSANLDALSALSSALANAGKVPMVANAGGWSLGSPLMDDRVINGAMRIDQRRVGAAVTPTGSPYLLDRWQFGATQNSKLTFQQLTPSPALAGFASALKVTVALNYATLAGDTFFLKHAIEGYNVADLDFGLASAKPIIVSFWVQSSITGTYSCAARNNGGARSYIATFSIPVANTWTYITLPIAGDTTGTWLTSNGTGIELDFNLGSGSTFATTGNSWQAGNFIGLTSGVNFVANAAATFWLTGVRLQPGSIATPYVLRPHTLELALCQRYYQKSYRQEDTPGTVVGSVSGALLGTSDGGTVLRLQSNLPVQMRTVPTGTSYSYATGASGVVRNDSTSADAAIAGILPAQSNVGVIANLAAANQQAQFMYTLDAEL